MKTVLLVLLMLSGTLYAGELPTFKKMKLSFLCNETIDSKPISDTYNKKKRKTSTFENKLSTCKKIKSIQISEELVNAAFNNSRHNYVVQCSRCDRLYHYGVLANLKYNVHRGSCSKGESHTLTLHSSPQQFTVKCIKSDCNLIFSGSLKEIRKKISSHIRTIKHKHTSYSTDELNSYVVEQLQTELHDELEAAKEEKNEKMEHNEPFDQSLDNQNSTTNEWKLSSSEEENPSAFSGSLPLLFGEWDGFLENETLMQ